MIKRTLTGLAAAALYCASPLLAQAAQPSVPDPLTVIVPYAPGGASDRAARIVAEGIQKRFGTSVIVENRSGAGGRIAAQYVKTADASRNMVVLANPAIMVVAPMVYADLAYDPQKDFQPIAMATQYGFGIAVAADNPIKTLTELVEWIKQNTGQFNVAVPATGSLPHFFGLMLAERIGVQAEIIGYKGSAPAITDLIGGQIPVAIDTLDAMTPQHENGRIRILATSGQERERSLPDVPTFSEQGIELVSSGWNTFFASAAMPADRVEALGEAISLVTADAEVQKKLFESELVPVSANAAETAQQVDAFREQWAPVIESSNFTVSK